MTAMEYLKLLDSAKGVSGTEQSAASVIKKLFSKYCDETVVDTIGNVIGKRKGKNPNAPSVMIEAHMDELGLMVSGITQWGSLKFISIGGVDPKILPGCEVTVHGKEKLFGVIGAKPPHLLTKRDKTPSIDEMAIDIGFSKERAERLVSVGDIVTINTEFTKLDGSFAAARCIDDRGGLSMVLRALELLCEFDIENEIIAVASVQEEVGLRGAHIAAGNIMPSCAISIDVGHAVSPGVSEEAFPCGKGPVITIGPSLNNKLTKKLIDISEKNNIDIQIEVCEGDTGTDAWEIQIAGGGVPVGLMSVPVRYMHGAYEVCDCSDIENGANLIALFAASYKGGEFECL